MPAAKGHHRFQVEAQRHKLSGSRNVFADALQGQATTWARSTSSEIVASPNSTAVSISAWFPSERNAAGSASGAPIATERSMSLLGGVRETLHTICGRILIPCPDGRVVNPTWNNEQVGKIATQSPLFERQILRLQQDSKYRWIIHLKETDDFRNDDFSAFIAKLGQPCEQSAGMEVERLCSRCSAMWHFQIVPSKVHLATYATDREGNPIASSSQVSTTSSVPTPTSGNSAFRVVTSSETSGSEREHWCWNKNCDHTSRETSLKLANIALVLGWREVFNKELKTVVWNWPQETLGEPDTPIHYLQKDSAKGLNKRRKREMKEIRDWFDSYQANNSKLPQKVKEILQEKCRKEFDDKNPYSWMRSLQKNLLPSDMLPRHDSALSQQSAAPTKIHNHPRGGNPTGSGVLKFVQKKVIKWSDHPEIKKAVEEMLMRAHNHIEERQNTVAEKLWVWRDEQVKSWEAVLEERYPNQTPNGVSIQAPAAKGLGE